MIIGPGQTVTDKWGKDFGNNPTIGIVTFYCSMQSRESEFELEGETGKTHFGRFSIDMKLLSLMTYRSLIKLALRRAYENHRN